MCSSDLNQFLPDIRVPALIVTAKDDPMVPFRVYQDAAVRENPAITFVPVEHGGHLGFIARTGPRFWLDPAVLNWMEQQAG